MKLLTSIKNEITDNENGEDVPHLEITEVLVRRSIVNKNR